MAREWSVTTESVKRSSERIGELVSKYQTEYEKLYWFTTIQAESRNQAVTILP